MRPMKEPHPALWIRGLLATHHFEHDGLGQNFCQGVSVSPANRALKIVYRIETADCSRLENKTRKYYSQKPPSIWTSTSRCIQLYSRAHDGW